MNRFIKRLQPPPPPTNRFQVSESAWKVDRELQPFKADLMSVLCLPACRQSETFPGNSAPPPFFSSMDLSVLPDVPVSSPVRHRWERHLPSGGGDAFRESYQTGSAGWQKDFPISLEAETPPHPIHHERVPARLFNKLVVELRPLTQFPSSGSGSDTFMLNSWDFTKDLKVLVLILHCWPKIKAGV